MDKFEKRLSLFSKIWFRPMILFLIIWGILKLCNVVDANTFMFVNLIIATANILCAGVLMFITAVIG